MIEDNKKEEEQFDREQLKKQLKEYVKSQGGCKNLGGQEFIQGLVKSSLELLLEAEMDEHLGYRKHDSSGRNGGNSRNGHSSKKVRGDFGEITIETPRDRQSEFEPEILKKRQTTFDGFSEKIVSLYARGMSTREIEEHLHEMYGIEVSVQFISRATDMMQEKIIEWQNRPLEPIYPIVFVDALRVSVHAEGLKSKVIKKSVYVVLGIRMDGEQEVLGLWISPTEGANFWLTVANELKNRGVKDILIACADGLKGLPDALRVAFPDVDIQLCVVHQIRNATRFVSWKDRKAFCADMREIYSAATVEAAELALDNLDKKWGQKYPMSIKSWRQNWALLITFFSYSPDLRKLVYTTNSIESLNSLLRKNASNRKVFPTDDSVIKLLTMNVMIFSKKWTRRSNWNTILNELCVLFADRISAAGGFNMN